jgi:hypothetical protein
MGFNFVFLNTKLNAGVSRLCADLIAKINIAWLLFLFLVLQVFNLKKNYYKLHDGIIYIPTAGTELGSGGFAHKVFKRT